MAHNFTDADLQALCEACADDGKSFGDTLKEVRTMNGNFFDLRTAIAYTTYGLQMASKAGHQKATEMLARWREIHVR